VACGLASALMTPTKTIYPPAGASALLAAVDPQVEALGWYLLPLVLLSSAVILVTSLLVNNIQRKYPTYWWTPVDLSKGKETDIEELPSANSSPLKDGTAEGEEEKGSATIRVTSDKIIVPEHLYLAAEEQGILEILRERLDQGARPPRPSAPPNAHPRRPSQPRLPSLSRLQG